MLSRAHTSEMNAAAEMLGRTFGRAGSRREVRHCIDPTRAGTKSGGLCKGVLSGPVP